MRRDRRDPLTRRGGRRLLVGVILVVALGLRVGYVEHTPYHPINDGSTYNRLASMVARYGDYHTGSKPKSGAGGSRGPTAYFPPAYPYFLGLVDIIDGHAAGHKPALQGERLAQAVTGTLAVGLLGLVALEAFGELTALVALALAAAYPVWIALSGTLVAENLLLVLELAAVWTALRAQRSDRPLRWLAGAGVVTGLATLTHENAALLLIGLGVVAVTVARRQLNRPSSGLRALAAPTILLIMCLAMIAPWTIRNSVELHHFIPVSDETGITLRGTYNPASAAFAPVPYKWRYYAKIPQDAMLAADAGRYSEVALGDRLQARAEDYIGRHPSAPLTVAWTNLRRLVELDGSYAWQAGARAIGLHVDVGRTGVIAFWVLGLLAIAGLFTRAARAAPRWLWAFPILYGLSIVFVNVETPRFREPIEPFLLLLAACAVSGALTRLRSAGGRWSRDQPAPAAPGPGAPGDDRTRLSAGRASG